MLKRLKIIVKHFVTINKGSFIKQHAQFIFFKFSIEKLYNYNALANFIGNEKI